MFASRALQASRQTVRTYAAQAAKGAVSVKPPVPLFGVDGNYASALVCGLLLLIPVQRVIATQYTPHPPHHHR